MRSNSTFRLLQFLVLGCTISGWGCSGSSNSAAAPPIGEPAPGEFDELKLEINGRDALGEPLTFAPKEPLKLNGSFRFAKPFRGRPPVGVVVIHFTMSHKGNEVNAQGASAELRFVGERRAQFSCAMTAPSRERNYTVKVIGNNRQIVMQTKARVEE